MKIPFLILLSIVCFYLFLSPVKIWAINPVFKDDFSSDFNKWQLERGNMAFWSIQNGKAQAVVSNSGVITELSPKSEFWPLNLKYYEYTLEYTPLQGLDRNITFGFEDINNWYELHFLQGTLAIRLFDGRVTWIKSINYHLANGTTHKIKLLLEEKRIQLYVNDTKLLDETNDDFVNFGKISLKAGAGAIAPTVVQFDNILVKPITDTTSLPILELKQTDPQWSDVEYDTANTWSPNNPFIKDWGCALTSMVMILQYHGITLLPNNENITPKTLNAWLQSQEDGYLHGGLINWFAITRLTQLISEKHGTKKLEYTRINGTDYQVSKAEIANNRPVILQLPGHFVVGKGVLENDVVISDPAYNYTLLSQHNKSLLSTRTFYPSNTDLSGIVVASSENTDIMIYKDQQPLQNSNSTNEKIDSPFIDISSPTIKVVESSKLKDGNYLIEIATNSPFEKYYLDLHIYDTYGNLKSKKIDGVTNGKNKSTYTFKIENNTVSNITTTTTFTTLREDLEKLYTQKDIQKKYLLLGIIQTSELAKNSEKEDQLRYFQFIEEVIDKNDRFFSATGKQYILQEIKSLKDT